MALTPKQARFVDLYVLYLNAAKAYREAYGCSESVAETSGPRLLRNVQVSQAIAEKQEVVAKQHGITLDSHLETLASLRDGAKSAEQYGAAITAETNRGKVAGLYVEKVEHSGKGGGPIQVWQFGKRKVAF